MSVSKLFLCNFMAPHIYETFFYNVLVGRTHCFYLCPCFHKKIIKCSILHESIICEQKDEVICHCLNCRQKIISTTNHTEEPNDFFDDLKKKIDSKLLS